MITIEAIPHETHRYPTVGDYWIDEHGDLVIKVSSTEDWRHHVLVGIHELIEAVLCQHRGVTFESIDAFDKAVPDDSPFANDPGHDPAAPYHDEHVFAEAIERLVARELGVNWQEYERALLALDEEATDGTSDSRA